MGRDVSDQLEQMIAGAGLATAEQVETTRRGLRGRGIDPTPANVLTEMEREGYLTAEERSYVERSLPALNRLDPASAKYPVQLACVKCDHSFGRELTPGAEYPKCPKCGGPSECMNTAKGPPPDDRPERTPPVVRDPFIGQTLKGLYTITEYIAAGGFATVYKSERTHEHTGQVSHHAVKILHGDKCEDEDEVNNFLAEADKAQRVDHPNVARIIDWGKIEMQTDPLGVGRRLDSPFIVMEFVDGTTLREILRSRRRLKTVVVLGIIEQIAGALRTAHEKGLIHRDVKPANIMVRHEDQASAVEAKLLDFGIGKVVTDMTRSGRFTGSGTLRYMAPEQEAGNPVPASDVYAMGLVLYELLNLRLPNEPPEGWKGAAKPRVFPFDGSETSDELRRRIETLVGRCLDPKPKKRPTMADLHGRVHLLRAEACRRNSVRFAVSCDDLGTGELMFVDRSKPRRHVRVSELLGS